MFKDCDAAQKQLSDEKQKELHEVLATCVHRRGDIILRERIPELHDWLVTMRPSVTQDQIIKEFLREENKNGEKNFFRYVTC